MSRLGRAIPPALVMALALALPASAVDSASASYRNSRSSLDSGGKRQTSASFRADAVAGGVSVSTALSASYLVRDGFMGVAFQPAKIADLWASSTALTTTVLLQWTAPGNDGQDDTVPGKFIIKYSSDPLKSPAASDGNFAVADDVPVAPPVPGQRGTVHTLTVPGLVAGVQYYFAIKTAERDGLRSVLSNGATAQVSASTSAIAGIPQEPFGLALSSAGAAITLRWMPVTRLADGTPFGNPNAATPAELSAYRVYRSTSLTQGTWTQLIQLSTPTVQWTDPAGGPQYFYAIRAMNTAGLSDRSVLRSVGSLFAYAVAPDDHTYLEVKTPSLAPIEGQTGVPMSAYLVEAKDRPEYLGGRVVKSVEFTAKQGGFSAASSSFELPSMGRLKLRYETASGAVVTSGVTSAIQAQPENLGVYWYNGVKWVQMYGVLDKTDQTLNVETKYLGQYELRLVERSEGFGFDSAGVSNKFVTPNGDGKNDGVVFTYDNPRDSAVRARILDLRGRVIVPDLPPGPVSNSRMWTGVAGGQAVPGGVYIYQIESEGRTFSGTVVVLK